MASKRFHDLEREIVRLRREFLPDRFDALGYYPGFFPNRTRAYLLLAHAAIEDYLELEAKRIARKAEDAWKRTRLTTRPLAFLLCCSGQTLKNLESSGNRAPEIMIEDVVRNAFEYYYKVVKDNHGLKERNMMALFGQLGLESAMFGTMLLPDLASFGATRGDHAHHGSAVVTHLDPQTEHEKVIRLLGELKAFDGEIRKYEKTIR